MIFGLENNPKNVSILVITFLFMSISFIIAIWNLCCSKNKNYMELNDDDNNDEANNDEANNEENINKEGKLVFNDEFYIDSDGDEDIAIMDV